MLSHLHFQKPFALAIEALSDDTEKEKQTSEIYARIRLDKIFNSLRYEKKKKKEVNDIFLQ